MKINITFNGNDGCGKTTQFNVMKKEYGDFIYFANDISTFNIFPNKQGDDFFEWWFFDSDLKDFAEIIYKGIFLQKEQIEKCDKIHVFAMSKRLVL